jgi:hypothetical protein
MSSSVLDVSAAVLTLSSNRSWVSYREHKQLPAITLRRLRGTTFTRMVFAADHRSGTAKFLAASGSMKALSASSVDGSSITLLHRPSPWSMTISFCVPGSMA